MHFPAKNSVETGIGGWNMYSPEDKVLVNLNVPRTRVNSNPRFSSCEPSKSTIHSTTILTPRATSQRQFVQFIDLFTGLGISLRYFALQH